MQFFDINGEPLVGGKVYTYQAGTATPQATYTDNTGVSVNSNPVVLNARGEASIWLGAAIYKFKLTDANDVEIWTVDYIASPVSGVSPSFTGNASLATNSSSPAFTITQSGFGPAMEITGDVTLVAPSVFTGAWAYLPAGTTMTFVQSAAPTGWTKSTTHNNKALRVVSGSASSGGSVAFTTAFSAARALSGSTDGHALTIAEIPPHTHTQESMVVGFNFGAGSNFNTTTTNTGSTGGGAAHSHTLGSGSVNLAVQYVDVIIAVKN
jgi:hypothetical protein